MKKRKFLLSRKLTLQMRWLCKVFTPSTSMMNLNLISPLLRKVGTIEKTRGQAELIALFKATRIAFLKYLAGTPLTKEEAGNVPLTGDGIPKILGRDCIEQVRKGNIEVIRLVLTVLFSTRALSIGKIPDFQTISREVKVPANATHRNFSYELLFSKKVRSSFWKELGYRKRQKVPKQVFWKQFHFTTKAGPNGHALWTRVLDLKNLMDNIQLAQRVMYLGGEKLSNTIRKLFLVMGWLLKTFPASGKLLRKLSWFPDKEDKVRVVAVRDYWSQTALRGLHSYLFKVLGKIPQDNTFDQGSFKDKISGWDWYDSCDLKAATDRFPIKLQNFVLKGVLPDEYVEAWQFAMVRYPFETKTELGEIRYGAGNPMGLYSSWNTFAVSHHYVVYCCAHSLGIPWKKAKYVLLGDDILFGDAKLARLYKAVILSLGVTFSPLKTFSSKFLAEFAKRLIFKGEEVTPFPISSLREAGKKYYLLTNVLLEEQRKGWVPTDGVRGAVEDYFSTVLCKTRTLRAKLKPWISLCEQVMKMARGSGSAYEVVNTCVRLFDIPLSKVVPRDVRDNILRHTAMLRFTESNPENEGLRRKRGYPLGKLAEDVTIKLTGEEDPLLLEDLLEAWEHIPILAGYGKVCNMFLDLKAEAVSIDTGAMNGKPVRWPLVLKTMALPLDDRVFTERGTYSMARSSAKVGKLLEQTLRSSASYLDRELLSPSSSSCPTQRSLA